MKGLLIKDMYTLRHYALWYLIYCLVFMLLAVLLENPAFVTGLAVEKLIIALTLSLITTALWALSYFLAFRTFDDPAELCITAALSFATVALSLPLSYKLGVERCRLVLGIIMLVLMVACVALLTAAGNGLSDASPLLFSALTVISVATCVPSLFITASVIRPDKSLSP